VIDNPGVSRHHATVAYEGGKYVVRDEQSQNGLFVSDRRVAEHVLTEGDVIQLGKFALAFNGLASAPHAAADAGAPSVARPGMVKTFALNAVEVQSVLAAHAGRKEASQGALYGASQQASVAPGTTSLPMWIIAAGVVLLAVVAGLLVLL
jgi:pSer/pThr/pTyr-binding forkhead associated (FHA) protein